MKINKVEKISVFFKKNDGRIAYTFLFLFLLILGVYSYHSSNHFQEYTAYTVGEITKFYSGRGGVDYFQYQYVIKGKYYSQRMSKRGCDDIIKLGRRFIVAYDSIYPKKSLIVCQEMTNFPLGSNVSSTFKPNYKSSNFRRDCCSQLE